MLRVIYELEDRLADGRRLVRVTLLGRARGVRKVADVEEYEQEGEKKLRVREREENYEYEYVIFTGWIAVEDESEKGVREAIEAKMHELAAEWLAAAMRPKREMMLE